jgi:hypothetical protein
LVELRAILRGHIGWPYEFAAVMHLGSVLPPLWLGAEDLFGTAEVQSERLDRFLSGACHMLGGFGSWWPETFTLLEAAAQAFPKAAIQHRLLLQSARGTPFEYDRERLAEWLAERPARSDHVWVLLEPADYPGTEVFDDWSAGLPPLRDAIPTRLTVVSSQLQPLPAPSLKLRGAWSRAVAPNVCEILLPLSALPSRRLQLAAFDNVDASKLRVTLHY